MLKENPIQFAVVREDPMLEAEIINKYKLKNLLQVCSGGCSVLSLKALFPEINITAFDFNPHQIELTQKKNAALSNTADFNNLFNINHNQANNLNQCGNFESLFKGLREFIFEFILDYEKMSDLFATNQTLTSQQLTFFNHKYWPVAFELFLHDSLLKTMFGQAAIQHAPSGSYSKYFQNQFEKAFKRADAAKNYFLHHVFLGHYLFEQDALPHYLAHPKVHQSIQYINGILENINDLKQYDLIQLSNIMDWMSENECKVLADQINKNTSKGTVILIRQLNNEQPILKHFPDFKVDEAFCEKLLNQDRSIFYSSILCLVRR